MMEERKTMPTKAKKVSTKAAPKKFVTQKKAPEPSVVEPPTWSPPVVTAPPEPVVHPDLPPVEPAPPVAPAPITDKIFEAAPVAPEPDAPITPPLEPVIVSTSQPEAVVAPMPVESPAPSVPEPMPVPPANVFTAPVAQSAPMPINISTGLNANIPSPEAMSTSDDGSSKKKKIIVGCLLLLVFVLLGVGIYLFRKESAKTPEKPIDVAPTEKAKETPASTESAKPPEIDLTKYSIKVLNGSGVSGEAAKVKTALEGAGFKISGTGNAKVDTFKETEIAAPKDTNPEYLKKLASELAKTYVMATQSGELASGSADVIVTVGSSKI